jgi:aryl-alcohol dehydrogenase-like predicted oxidoreductase
MKYLDFGDSKLSKIGLGTVRFGSLIPEDQSYAIMDAFLSGGGNVVDTARGYFQEIDARGKSEETIGKWLGLRNNRNKVILITKGGKKYFRDKEKDRYVPSLDRLSMIKEAQESLEALGTDYIDIYLVHCDDTNRSIEEIVDMMQGVKAIVKAKAIGVSNWSIERLREANNYAQKHGLTTFSANEFFWSIAEYNNKVWNSSISATMNSDLYNYIVDNDMLGIAYTFQAKGYFQKAFAVGIKNLEPNLRSRIETPRNLKIFAYLKKYCQENNVSPTAVVTGYITSGRAKGIALAGCSTVEQMDDILNNCDYDLPQNIIDELDSI